MPGWASRRAILPRNLERQQGCVGAVEVGQEEGRRRILRRDLDDPRAEAVVLRVAFAPVEPGRAAHSRSSAAARSAMRSSGSSRPMCSRTRRPSSGCGSQATPGVRDGRQDERLEAAPAGTETEERQRLDEAGIGGFVAAAQLDAEEAGRAAELASATARGRDRRGGPGRARARPAAAPPASVPRRGRWPRGARRRTLSVRSPRRPSQQTSGAHRGAVSDTPGSRARRARRSCRW